MIRLAVVSGVGNDRLDPHLSARSQNRLLELGDIGTRPSRRMNVQHHVGLRIADDAELGKSLISRGLIKIWLTRPPLDVIRTAVT